MKKCRECGETKPFSEWHKNKRNPDGLSSECAACRNKWQRADRAKRKGVNQKYLEASRLRNQEYVYRYLLENPCVDCEESNPVVLEFDHVRGVKKENLSVAVNCGRSIEVIDAEIAKCDVVCANCHRKRTASRAGFYRHRMQEAHTQT